MMFKSLLAASTLAGLAAAAPAPAGDALKVSTDGSCGGTSGFTCAGSSFGNCCSKFGWCGTGEAYCGSECQASAGKCTGSSPTTSQSSKPSSTQAPTSTATAPSTLTDCLGDKDVPISLISSNDFAALSKPYNLRLPHTPAVIVLPTTEQHVSDAVVCAAQNDIKVQARGGGHSYAAYGLGGKDGSMMIDLHELHDINVDATTGIATAGGGTRLGNLAQGIHDQGKRAMAHGTCPAVGLGGHATHGGYGYDSRNWGLAMDQIIGLDVVLADGTQVHATETENSDVYWACRGAADSIGIVTKFYLQTHEAPESIVYFSYGLADMWQSGEQTATYFQHIQDVAQNATVVDRKIGFGMYMDGSGFSLSGTYFGTEDEFNSKIAPELLRGLPKPTSSDVQSMGWIASLQKLGGASTITVPTSGYDQHDNFFAKSVTVPEDTPLTHDALTSYFDYMINQGKTAGASWYSIVNLYGGPDSQINNKDTSFAAYSDRNSLWVAQHYIFTSADQTLPQSAMTFLDGLNDAMTSKMPNAEFGAYLNYIDPSLSAEEAHKVYYGDALYERLESVKKAVDPKSVFWNPQAIGA
ncbi:carbohydrate-binding module family 18 [Aplosporella prunicola CBS 121167]|uniref:Carbohydrate-binding module family 18 n=1 Tax=Aplosporella prunicola CBS 121167 TaxID=1176127 RepID=A0A6A6B725_9PEZI|nr:carbohydrate-binding module family 18 [Aplosporella prunicola CBS 121167]KAF2138787.1 carbohydrate-binding module family 18 [Aplosporella prunicola CBS 121167]